MRNRLKEIRESLKLSVEFVAKELEVRLEEVVQMESGSFEILIDNIKDLSNLYRIEVSSLFSEKDYNLKGLEKKVTSLGEQDAKAVKDLIGFKERYKNSIKI